MPEIRTFKIKEAMLFSVKKTIQEYPVLLVAVIKSILAIFAASIALSFMLVLSGGAISPFFSQSANIFLSVILIAICGSFSRFALSVNDGENKKSFKVVDLKGSLRLLITNLTVQLPFVLVLNLLVYLPDSLSDFVLFAILGLLGASFLYATSRTLYANYFIVDYNLGSLDSLKNSFTISSKSKVKSLLWYGSFVVIALILLTLTLMPFSFAITELPINALSLENLEANIPMLTEIVVPKFFISLAISVFTLPIIAGMYFFGSAKIFRDLSDEEVPEYEILLDSNTATGTIPAKENAEI